MMPDRFILTNLNHGRISLVKNDSEDVCVPVPMNGLIQMIIEKSWCKETSASPDLWTRDNPALGQCAVTALLFQGMVGGEILKTDIKGFGSHYWNRIRYPFETTVDYDLTRKQFPNDLEITEAMTVHRNEILQSERAKKFRTPERYQLLRKRFLQFMSEKLHLLADR